MNILKQIIYELAEVAGGYTDRILKIDLGRRNINIVKPAVDFKDKYIGGRGYALKLIWDETTKETVYDSQENILVMAGGPLGNEPGFPGTGKFIVGTISPLADTFIDSNVGGHFAPLMKLAGLDALAVKGISGQEVVIIIDADSGTISIVSAPVYEKNIDEGSISFGETLLQEFCEGQYNEFIFEGALS